MSDESAIAHVGHEELAAFRMEALKRLASGADTQLVIDCMLMIERAGHTILENEKEWERWVG